jgi:hypothetical protein
MRTTLEGMNPETLFLRTVADLEQRTRMNDSYEVLRSSLLIRQLLLDGGISLLDQVNRTLRLPRPVFRVHPAGTPPLPPEVLKTTTHLVPDGIDPEACSNAPGIVELDRDRFLQVPVGSVRGEVLTVHTVVDYSAHALGGVHAGTPSNDEKARALAELSGRLQVVSLDPSLAILRPIGRIVVRAMQPYRDALQARERDLG